MEVIGGETGLTIAEAAAHYAVTTKTLRNRVNDGVCEVGGVPFDYRKIEGPRGPEYRFWIGGTAPAGTPDTVLPPEAPGAGTELAPATAAGTLTKALQAAVASRLAPVEKSVNDLRLAVEALKASQETITALASMVVDERAHVRDVYRALATERERAVNLERQLAESQCPWWRDAWHPVVADGDDAPVLRPEVKMPD